MIELFYILACWRITNMIYSDESGPWHVFDYFRAFICRSEMVAKMVQCPLCVSVWVAGILAVLYWLARRPAPFDLVAIWLGMSGGTCLIYITLEIGHKAVERPVAKLNHTYFQSEDGKESFELAQYQ